MNYPLNEDKIKSIVEKILNSKLNNDHTSDKYLTPEQLCKRWQINMKTLEKWRLQGKPPIYMKVQASKKAAIRYPLHIENGVLDVEEKWLRNSTSDQGK